MDLSIYVILTILVFIIAFAIKERKVRKLLNRSHIILNQIMRSEEKDSIIIDMEFEDGVKILETLKKQSSVSPIGDEYKKGYDFLVVKQKSGGSIFPTHSHNISSEFFYVVSGSITLIFSTKDPVNLKTGDCAFVKSKESHSVFAEEPSEYIIVAKPPLLKRVGSFYERFF
jgi:mannose-6-phosphate isomerase-like protein (cupin superfamily)